MKRKKESMGEDEAVKTKWFTLSYKGIICLMVLAVIIGIFTVLIFNVGYDNKAGWYWKPNNLEIKIKKSKE